MIRCLLALIAHVRAGHRIGCVEPNCAFYGRFVARPESFDPAKHPWNVPIDLTDEEAQAFVDAVSREPVVAPAPARGTDRGPLATGSRPHAEWPKESPAGMLSGSERRAELEAIERQLLDRHHDPARPHTLYVADPPADFGQQVFIPGPSTDPDDGPLRELREDGRL